VEQRDADPGSHERGDDSSTRRACSRTTTTSSTRFYTIEQTKTYTGRVGAAQNATVSLTPFFVVAN